MGGVYKIVNKINNKIYIGKSIDVERRLNQHLNALRKNKHINKYLQHSWNKYGESCFSFETILSSSIEKELDDAECYYISIYNSNNDDYGYNLTSGGDGGSHTKESIEKMKISVRGKGTNLTFDDVRRIKLALCCLMDRKEISKIFNVSKEVIDGIAMGNAFSYILEDLNEHIFKLKQKMIDDRNVHILELFNTGLKISEISRITSYSESIIEKCIYKYTSSVQDKKTKYQKIFDDVFDLYDKGINKYQISKQLNISPSTVDRYLSGKNNPYNDLPFKKLTKDLELKILKLYFEENKNIKEISNIHTISRQTISNFIYNYKNANTEVS